MSLEIINLRKLIKLMYLERRGLTTALRSDIREERDRERGLTTGGGDFYGPFWKDAKDHVFGWVDLTDATAERIADNERRKNLYPQLKDGFLLWWNKRRRWTNAPFEPIDSPKTRFRVPDAGVTIKIDSVLSVQDGRGDDRYIYPYWFPQPALTDESARVSLWLLMQALPHLDATELRVLDVVRGQTYSLDRNPLQGDEKELFSGHYNRIVKYREELRDEYDH